LAEAAGEGARAVGVVEELPGPRPGTGQAAGAAPRPQVDVGGRIAHHGRLTFGPRRGVQAHDLRSRHGEEPEGIVVAQLALVREGQPRQVVERPDALYRDTGSAQAIAVE